MRSDLDRAKDSFKWPHLETFNWTLDWFDAELATKHNEQIALRIVGTEGPPLVQGGGAPGFVVFAADEVALLIEEVVDRGVD